MLHERIKRARDWEAKGTYPDQQGLNTGKAQHTLGQIERQLAKKLKHNFSPQKLLAEEPTKQLQYRSRLIDTERIKDD